MSDCGRLVNLDLDLMQVRHPQSWKPESNMSARAMAARRHGTEVRTCLSTDANGTTIIRVIIQHWHGPLNAMDVGTLSVRDESTGLTSTSPATLHVSGYTGPDLEALCDAGFSAHVISNCSGQNVFTDWGVYDFPMESKEKACDASSSFTILAGDSMVMDEACADLYPVTASGARICYGTSDDVSISADPHVKDLRGRKFDVRKLGTHTMLVIPNGDTIEKSLLHVSGTVTSATKDCSVAFLHNIVVSGRWLKDSAPKSEKCGAISQLQFSAADAPDTQDNWTGFTIGNSSFGSMEKLSDCGMHKMIKFQRPGEPSALPAKVNTHATSMTAQLALGPVRVKLSWVTHRIHDFSLVNALWMSVSGLSAVPETIGGVLSADDHHEVETMDADCWTADQSKMQ